MEFYKYRLTIRTDNNNANDLHRFGKLFQQFIVDMYARLESNRLGYICHNQDRLRSDLYRSVADITNVGDNNMAALGRCVILPSSFTGSPGHLQQLYQDAMSIVRRFGKPTFLSPSHVIQTARKSNNLFYRANMHLIVQIFVLAYFV